MLKGLYSILTPYRKQGVTYRHADTEQIRDFMSNQAVEIKILGRTLKVNCPTGQEAALIAAAEDFDQRLQNLSERTKVSNPEQLLMFAGLNICSELHSERREKDNKADDLSNRISQLAETLDKALQNQPKR